jgi:hypothetical protein
VTSVPPDLPARPPSVFDVLTVAPETAAVAAWAGEWHRRLPPGPLLDLGSGAGPAAVRRTGRRAVSTGAPGDDVDVAALALGARVDVRPGPPVLARVDDPGAVPALTALLARHLAAGGLALVRTGDPAAADALTARSHPGLRVGEVRAGVVALRAHVSGVRGRPRRGGSCARRHR